MSEETTRLTTQDRNEISQLLTSLKGNVEEVNEKLAPMIEKVNDDEIQLNCGISYLEAKNSMFLIYLTYLAYYIKLKTTATFHDGHPVVKRLIQLKTILERTKSIDLKLKNQLDRLLRLAEEKSDGANPNNEAYRLRSQILNDEENDGEDEELEQEEAEVEEKQKRSKELKYKVQKNMMEYFETTSEAKKKKKQLEKQKEKIRNSEYFEDIKHQIGDNPLEVKSQITEIDKFNQYREEFEDENFVRLKVSKKDLRKLKKKDKNANDLLSHTKELKNISNILDEDLREEMDEHMKIKSSRKMMNEQMKNYLGNKMKRNDRGAEERREKHFERKQSEKQVWKKREFIRNKHH